MFLNNFFVNLFNTLFVKKTDKILIQLFRYTFVGGVAFLVDASIYAVLIKIFHVHYLISGVVGFLFGLITNYLLSILWVFSKDKVANRIFEFLLFAGIGLIGLGLNEIILYVAVDMFDIDEIMAKIISTVIVFLWNFLLRKFLLFGKMDIYNKLLFLFSKKEERKE